MFEPTLRLSRTQLWLTTAALLTLLGATLFIYWPGLNGPLLLDDTPNLRPLSSVGTVDDASSFWWFVLHRSSSYPLRPLSYASFLINDLGWPLYVWMHKYTNLLIHLLNGMLVFWLALLLARAARQPLNITICIALTTMALWLLAPLQVSTVLYLIQRMTQLSALFVLCGVISYCYARQRLNDTPMRAIVQMTLGIAVFGALGFLSKENAILLPLYILVVEHTVFRYHSPVRDTSTSFYFRIWKWTVLVAPVVLAFAFLIYRGALRGYQTRPFTAFERIASQPRILFDYLQNLLLPMRQGMSITHDDYVLSTSLLSPPTTLLAILALLGLLAVALYVSRRTASLFALAVLWFIAGHLLESSILPLERYWEHRNYLPAFGVLFAVAFGVWTMRARLRQFLKVALGVYAVMFATITTQNVLIWSDVGAIAEVWGADHPRSLRAQQLRANYWSQQGYLRKAHGIMERIAELRPDLMGAQLQLLLTTCRHKPADVPVTFSKVMSRLDASYYDHSVFYTIKILMDIRDRQCPELTYDNLLELTNAVLENETVDRRSDSVTALLALKAAFLSKTGNAQAVVSHLYAAFDRRPTYSLGLLAVDYLYQSGQYEVALQVLDETAKLKPDKWSSARYRRQQIEKWRTRIMSELKDQAAQPAGMDSSIN